ncbi:hypothetical protein BST81_15120 [Leptolyngbya sp. 'hensonii']|uniref:CHAT domain-containing protein n=1 Tax=Leptolyngbya sp. 'hensonii' TaxID=1922337 RepID=UPI00094FCED4|nr:CHAT domain-containing protein [Leptolyngbya sp. 'hensonii']OLP17652.1 hypothetical protein BST81_15120 [Leptolyngbya sp. 'hensonii']
MFALNFRSPVRTSFLAPFIALLALASAPLPLQAIVPPPQLPLLAQANSDRVQEGSRLLDEGFAQLNNNQPDQALKTFQRARQIFKEIKSLPGEGYVLLNMGLVYMVQQDYQQADTLEKQALEIARQFKLTDLEARALINLGLIRFRQQDTARAIEYYQQSLPLTQQLKDTELELKVLINLGDTYVASQDYSQAIQTYEQGLKPAQASKNRPVELQLLAKIGDAYFGVADYLRMIDYYKQLLPLSQELKKPEFEVLVLGQIGVAYRELGDTTQAIQYLQQGLTLARKVDNRREEGRILGYLGDTYRLTGEYRQAIESGEQSLAIARQVKDRAAEQWALLNLGNVHNRIGEYGKAVDRYQESLKIARDLKDKPGEAQALNNLGEVYRLQKDYKQAAQRLNESLAISQALKLPLIEGNTLLNLGNIYLEEGNINKAIDYYQQTLNLARRIKDRQKELLALSNLGWAYVSIQDYPRSIESSRQALTIIRETKDRWAEGLALNNLGIGFWQSGDLANAEKTFLEAVVVRESIRAGLSDSSKVSLFETQTNVFHNLQRVLILQNKAAAALEIAERGRARAFVELLARRARGRQGMTSDEVSVKPIQMAEIQQIAKAQKATLVQYSVVQGNFTINGRQEARDSILYIWVVQPTGALTFRYVDLTPLWQKQETSLKQLVQISRAEIGVRGRLSFQENTEILAQANNTTQQSGTTNYEHLKQLHQLLIAPIADLLPQNPESRVIFIPQDALFMAPFAALQSQAGKFLIEEHTVLIAPSIQVLDFTHRQRQKMPGIGRSPLQDQDVLIVGNPVMPSILTPDGLRSEPLFSLPGAEKEAREIAALFQVQPLIGKQATKAVVKERIEKARLIHLATHGLLDDFTGLGIPGAVALAPSGQDNGLLTAGDILDLRLNAELVVLSACDTGRGRITGDGVIGLSRSLISAGAPSVIVSLWQVPDAPTAFLMTQFYKNLQKNPDKAQALRQAMLTTKLQYPDPKAWAAFTLIGEAE